MRSFASDLLGAALAAALLCLPFALYFAYVMKP
jgi:hypothetical protein